MAIYRRGENGYIDFTFKGQRIRETTGSGLAISLIIPMIGENLIR